MRGRASAAAPEVVVAEEHEELAGSHFGSQLPVAVCCELTRSVLLRRYEAGTRAQDNGWHMSYTHGAPSAVNIAPASTLLCEYGPLQP